VFQKPPQNHIPTVVKHLRKTIHIIILLFILVSCSVEKGIVKQMNAEFKTKYPEIEKYSQTEYQEKLRKRVLSKFFNEFKLEKSNLYVIETFQNRGGHHVITKYQTVMTYFWQEGNLLEVYYVNDNDELEIKKEQYWGTENMIRTLEFIQNRFETNDLDSISKISKSWEHQYNHAGEYFITELDKNLQVLKIFKCEEFGFE
jgi:hypothetical protein